VLQHEKAVNLWFLGKETSSDFQQGRFYLETNLLGQEFGEVAAAQLVAVALSAVEPVDDHSQSDLAAIIAPVVGRLRRLRLEYGGLTERQHINLTYALARARWAVAWQMDDPAALDEARELLTDLLPEINRDIEPDFWAKVQFRLGSILSKLGELRASSTVIEQGIVALNNALEIHTREHSASAWASIQVNLGIALRRLTIHGGDQSALQKSIQCFEGALEEKRRP
jgi:hypothetical protein